MLSHHRSAILFLLKHLAAGSAGGLLLGTLILWHDVAGITTMIAGSSEGALPVVMLFFGLFVTFGSLGMAVGIMGLGEERDSDPIPRQ